MRRIAVARKVASALTMPHAPPKATASSFANVCSSNSPGFWSLVIRPPLCDFRRGIAARGTYSLCAEVRQTVFYELEFLNRFCLSGKTRSRRPRFNFVLQHQCIQVVLRCPIRVGGGHVFTENRK